MSHSHIFTKTTHNILRQSQRESHNTSDNHRDSHITFHSLRHSDHRRILHQTHCTYILKIYFVRVIGEICTYGFAR